MSRPIFSGHETFRCKTHWLKRGYDFMDNNGNFNDEDAVVRLGVGKNMVSSIKFWMKAFGLVKEDNRVDDIADYLLDDDKGVDPYFEDMGTLWLLHFLLVQNLVQLKMSELNTYRSEIDKEAKGTGLVFIMNLSRLSRTA